MRKVFTAFMAVGVLLLAGCGNGDETTSAQESSPTITSADAALDEFVAAVSELSDLGSTSEEMAASFQSMIDSLAPLGGELGIAELDGVPSDVSRNAGVAAGVAAVEMQLVVDCLQENEASPSTCDPFISTAIEDMRELGAAMGDLADYSTMGRTAFIEKFSAAVG